MLLVSCTSITPQYVPQTNRYTQPLLADTNLSNYALVHTYTTESLQSAYESMFCGNLIHCTLNVDSVKNAPEFAGFDLNTLPIAHNPYHIESINLYRVVYNTIGQNGESETVSGGVYIPQMDVNKIKGVVLFFHPTFFAKSSVSSYNPQGRVNSALAALFASSGYVVLAPDYIGMGINKHQVHPYVIYPQVNAADGLSILATFRQMAGALNLSIANKTLPLFVSGYSEGSSYALWFSRLYQENQNFQHKVDNLNYQLRMVAPISGAYDLSAVVYNNLYSNNNLWNTEVYKTNNSLVTGALKPPLAALSLIAFAYYTESGNYDKVFNPDFFHMQCSWQFASNCSVANQQLSLLQLLAVESQDVHIQNTNNALDIYVVNKINNAAKYKFYNHSFYTLFTNSIKPLVSESLVYNQKLHVALSNADVYDWQSTIPTLLLTLERDSVVSPVNSEYAYRGMLDAHSRNLSLLKVENSLIKTRLLVGLPETDIDHLTGFVYLFIIVRNAFDNIAAPARIMPST